MGLPARMAASSAARIVGNGRDPRPGRRGFALVMVSVAVGVAGVFGLALLASAALRGQAAANANLAAQADALADSGVQLAAFYLANPAKAPASAVNAWKYWGGESGVTLGPTGSGNAPAVAGSVSVTVSQLAPQGDVYDVTATGAAGARNTLTHTTRARLQANYAPINYALAANGPLALGANVTVNGNVLVNGALSLTSALARVNGSAAATASAGVLGTITVGGKINLVPAAGPAAPCIATPATVQDYRSYLFFNGLWWGTVAAQNVGSIDPTYNLDSSDYLGPRWTNPAGVYYSTQNVTLDDDAQVNGTLIVQSGNLIVNGSRVTLNAPPGYPALVILNGNLVSKNSAATLTVNGLAFIGGTITNSGGSNKATLTFNGALILGGASPSISPGAGTVIINYDATKTAVPHFDTQAASVSVVSWQE